jgi:hypothetical protein
MGCYNDDVLFIHIPKCGGTAVKEYMAQNLTDVKWPRNAHWFAMLDGRIDVTPGDEQRAAKTREESGLPIGHVPLRDIPNFTGRDIDSWERIIAVIRNPYHQQVSQWLFWRDRYAMGYEHPHDMYAAMHPRFDSWVGTPDADFHIWYEHRKSEQTPLAKRPPSAENDYANWGGFYPYWIGVGDKIPDNVQVLRQETLAHELPLALAPFMDGTPPPLHTTNVGPAKESKYLEYINRWEAVDAIEAKFFWAFDNELYPKIER